MKVMFDENFPWEFKKDLEQDGHKVVRVQSYPGWQGTKDDRLLIAKAAQEGCHAFITADKTKEGHDGVGVQAQKVWDGKDGKHLQIAVLEIGDRSKGANDIEKLRPMMPQVRELLQKLDLEVKQDAREQSERISKLGEQGIDLKSFQASTERESAAVREKTQPKEAKVLLDRGIPEGVFKEGMPRHEVVSIDRMKDLGERKLNGSELVQTARERGFEAVITTNRNAVTEAERAPGGGKPVYMLPLNAEALKDAEKVKKAMPDLAKDISEGIEEVRNKQLNQNMGRSR